MRYGRQIAVPTSGSGVQVQPVGHSASAQNRVQIPDVGERLWQRADEEKKTERLLLLPLHNQELLLIHL